MTELRALLVCPVCRSSLGWTTDRIVCDLCGRAFEWRAGAPDLTPSPPPDHQVAEQWPLWEELQANGELAYRANPEASLSVGPREDALAFGRFCELTGLVLDIGCGPQTRPSYATGFEGVLVGIDPLRGVIKRDFSFVQGLGEYLPFPDSTFDRVLFATSLDHMLAPQLAIREAQRVLKSDGRVIVWMGVPGMPAASLSQRLALGLRLLATGQWGEFSERVRAVHRRSALRAAGGAVDPLDLPTPNGALDPFHASQPSPGTVTSFLEAAGLEVERQEFPSVDQCWISAKRSGEYKP